MKQHYLPKCYLNEFALDNFTLWTLQLKKLHPKHNPLPRRYSPDAICKDKDIYTIDVELQSALQISTLHKYTIEHDIFKNYEDDYPSLLAKVKNQQKLSYEEHYYFLRIIISIKLRNKFFRKLNSGQRFTEVINQIFIEFNEKYVNNDDHQFSEISREERYITVQNVKQSVMNNPDFERSMYLDTLIQRELRPDGLIVQIVNRMMLAKWKIFITNDQIKFVTSDNPGFCIDESGMFENTKFAEGLFIFPLTPDYCLAIDYNDPDHQFWNNSVKKIYYQAIEGTAVAAINRSSSFYVNEHLIASDKALLNVWVNQN